jgi:AcrR family transcriptional regulator
MFVDEERPAIRKRKRGLQTEGRILECAAELFARKGYENATLSEIADAAGIRESSVYNHFGGKAAILSRLLQIFREETPSSRPSEEEQERMLDALSPEEVMKGIVFYFGIHVSKMLERIAMIVGNEKYHCPEAARTYDDCVVEEPSGYYERLFRKMIARGLIRDIDARMFAEQYNYVLIALTKEYFMADLGLKDRTEVVRYMVRSIGFFCDLMKAER